MGFFRQLYEQFATIWRSLNLQQRVFVGVGFAIALVGLLLLTVWQTTPQYSVLFSNLQQRDAGEIVTSLQGMKVPYKLSDDGGTILVPQQRVTETRLTLAQEGLPRGGGVGYEIFDRSHLGITSFEQRVNLKRATEGELARTINQLDEVEWSRVQIGMAEERLFTEQQEDVTASVFLHVLPGESLNRRQIQAVRHLVAHSVEGLRPDNVTIVDQYANPLATASDGGMGVAELSSSQFELRSTVERYFQSKIQSMFDRVVGVGNSVVSVSVDLDFDSIERTEETYDPDSAVVRSEQRHRESTAAPTVQGGGIAGVSANLPTVSPVATTAIGSQKHEASTSTTNYEISKSIAHIIKSPSSIKSISISVVVDGTYRDVTAPDGTATKEYVPRTEEEMEKYRRMVMATVGDPATHSADVINVPLQAVPVPEPEAGPTMRERRDLYMMIARGVITVAVLVLIFLLVRYLLKRALPVLPVGAGPEVGSRVDMVAGRESDVMEEVKEMAIDRPEDVASLLKAWVKEEE